MCNNHPAHTSPWLILAHQCTYCNIACSPAICTEDHTAVSGFSGNTNRATHRGDFNCVVRAQRGRLIHLVDPSSPLVIPDNHRNLHSVRHAQNSGLTQNKELAICLVIDYMASTNIASSFDYSTKFSRIANPMWATGSEHEDKKSNNQYSECNDKEETYAHYNETL